MLSIYFGDMPQAIYNTPTYFNNVYLDSWLEDALDQRMIKAVDKGVVCGPNAVETKALGLIPPTKLSGGVKTLMLIHNLPDKVFNASNCGNNCARWILEIAKKQDVTINLRHIMDFGDRKLKTVTAEHLQAFMDFLTFGGQNPDGTTAKALSKGYLRLFSAVLQGAFRFAVFPKRLITFNPMQYVVWRGKKEEYELFSDEDGETASTPTLSYEQYQRLEDFLKKKNNPALLPIQIAYYTGLRIGEVCGLTWQDINLEEQYLTVRRSMRYNGARHKTEIGATKRKKIRTVDFCDTLAAILKTAKTEQHKNRFRYGELYSLNYYLEVKEKDRTYYEVYSLPRSEEVPEGYKELSFVCLRPDGAFEAPSTVGIMCRTARKKVEGLEDFHFHMLRHTYTSNLLSNGAAPKDVQELLGHADVSTTMNIYAHATREAKRTSARLLDKVIGGE